MIKLSEAEWQLMNALWNKHPATAREIASRLPTNISWAYTTIKTMLSRLVEKKAIKEQKNGNISIYDPVVTRNKARRNALKSLVNQAFDGAFGPLMHFLLEEQSLSEKQRSELVRLLHEKDSYKKSGNMVE